MTSRRATIDPFLRSPPHNKLFSIISNPAVTEANKILDAFVKDLRKKDKIAGVIHKKAISKEQVKELFHIGELEPANSLDPAQLQKTAWFFSLSLIVIFLGHFCSRGKGAREGAM